MESFSAYLMDALLDESSEIAISPYMILEPPSVTSNEPPTDIPIQSTHPFVLYDHSKLVIPQNALYMVYSLAIIRLGFSNGIQIAHLISANINKDVREEENRKGLDMITKIIILQTPEHAKALNIRKRLVQRYLLSAERNLDSAARKTIIKDELHLVYLIIGIASNAKMAPLWHHRKWLLSLSMSPKPSIKWHQTPKQIRSIPPVRLPNDTLGKELALVDQCVQRYPRNYQAWAYRAWLMEPYIRGETGFDPELVISDVLESDDLIMGKEFTSSLRHLSMNITDHTAIMHILRLARTARYEQESYDLAMDLVRRYPYKETPWLFLRGIAKQSEDANLITRALDLAEQVIHNTSECSKLGAKSEQADWQSLENSRSYNLARRSEFYFQAHISNSDISLGSVQARELLTACR